LFPAANPETLVFIDVSIANQWLTLQSPTETLTGPISSGRKGYSTRRGCYIPHSVEEMHYSRTYDNAPMPHSVFYFGGYAIHGTYEENLLGRPASHGCVRVSRRLARQIYDVVRRYGRTATQVCVE
jgi:lipoprotein-anchoring transpeptidase ErfK/SrfK